MEVTRNVVMTDGAIVAYRLRRPAAPRRAIVLIHGVASNLTRWSEFVADTRLAHTWDLLRVDLRGHGGSVHRGRIGMDEWCADLAAILRAESVPQAVLVGHCLGANVALWFADRNPKMTAGLVLIEPMFRRALTGLLAKVAAVRPLFAPVVLGLRALAALGIHRRRLAPLDLAELDREARAAMARTGGTFLEERYASPWHDLRIVPTIVYLQDLLAVSSPLPDLAGVRVPVLALLSTGAAFSDPHETERRLAALPRCEIVRLEARHWIPTEQPAAMREAIEEWCARR